MLIDVPDPDVYPGCVFFHLGSRISNPGSNNNNNNKKGEGNKVFAKVSSSDVLYLRTVT
jgi:hypothetical protein